MVTNNGKFRLIHHIILSWCPMTSFFRKLDVWLYVDQEIINVVRKMFQQQEESYKVGIRKYRSGFRRLVGLKEKKASILYHAFNVVYFVNWEYLLYLCSSSIWSFIFSSCGRTHLLVLMNALSLNMNPFPAASCNWKWNSEKKKIHWYIIGQYLWTWTNWPELCVTCRRRKKK